jgi:hypothetical protein
MNIPMQSTPVQRLAGSAGRWTQSGGISPSEHIAQTGQLGVQPDGIFGDIWDVVRPIAGQAAQAGLSALPGLLGGLI